MEPVMLRIVGGTSRMHFAAKVAGILITPNYTADGKKSCTS